ncbi:MAG TPA: hypothetical protein VHG09_12530, partial [Longimicrobiales bacterium]|nr:hypothetical protein [Longimicrobiales bacterium]
MPRFVNRMAATFAALLCAGAPVAGQEMVPVDVLALHGQVPPPPSSPQEAYERAGCGQEGGCDAGRVFGPIEERFTAISHRLDAAQIAWSQRAQPSNAMQNMSQAELLELQKKLAAMSQAEQIEFATQLSRSQGAALAPEPPSVRAALDAARVMAEQLNALAISQRRETFLEVFTRLRAESEREHGVASAYATDDRWKDAVGLPGPEWEQAQIKAMEMHIIAENEYLDELRNAMNEEAARQNALFADFQKKLAASRYGAEAVNAMSRSQLLAAQQTILEAA